jgi:hypothetical protein
VFEGLFAGEAVLGHPVEQFFEQIARVFDVFGLVYLVGQDVFEGALGDFI